MSKAAKGSAKKAAKTRTIYLVVRDAFGMTDYDGVHAVREYDDEQELSEVPVRAFSGRKAAVEHARQLDEEVRATFPPPFLVDDDSEGLTKQLVAALVAKVKAADLPAIQFGTDAFDHPKQFREWWSENVADMSHEQRVALWEPFAAVTFHRVKEIDLEG
jgi:hypothetical protein